jgi:tripartite ATP-independent transporter DctM subunit
VSRVLTAVEDAIAALALALMFALPLAEIVLRLLLGVGIPASGPIVQHLVLWVGLLGAAIAAREQKLLAFATGALVPEGRARRLSGVVTATISSLLVTLLVWGAVELVRTEREAGGTIGAGIPVWAAQLVLPAAFALIVVRLVWQAGASGRYRAMAATGIVAAAAVIRFPPVVEAGPFWPWLTALLVAAAIGAPIFALLGGAAALLFMRDGVTPAAVLVETYALNTSPVLPAVPLFTLAGFLLAEGETPSRLLRVFRAWFGWIPGGTAVVCTALCTFFTAFTGGSGVTILALGGLLFPALVKEGYGERFSLGLLTASGSLGLLLPPSLPLILYAVVAQLPVEDLFVGGLLPGVILTALAAAWSVRRGIASGAGRVAFDVREGWRAIFEAGWVLLLPLAALAALFSGAATTIEAAALVACGALAVQTLAYRELRQRGELLRVCRECLAVVGGILVILGVAVGLTSYLVSAQVPARLVDWTTSHVSSQAAFLLGLNLVLLVVGCLMDIFSAIVVVAPLLVPLGAAYGVHPVHLGVIFVANLELGYLTPPVGLNLFLASYRFQRPLLEVTRAALPMLLILGAGVLTITYVPWLTLGLLGWLGRQ